VLLLLVVVMELLAPSFVHDEMIIFAAPPHSNAKALAQLCSSSSSRSIRNHVDERVLLKRLLSVDTLALLPQSPGGGPLAKLLVVP
jgi:hypothetical protein